MAKFDCYGGEPPYPPEYDNFPPEEDVPTFKISEVDECGHESFGQFGRCLYKYTDCGPWVVAILPDGTEIYYEDQKAYELPIDTEVRALKVGSIVEGSEYYVGPFEITDPKEFWPTVEAVDNEASAAWDHFNHAWFRLFVGDEPVGWAKAGWEDEDCEGLDDRQKSVLIRWLERYGYEQSKSWLEPYKKMRVLCTNIWVQQEENEFFY